VTLAAPGAKLASGGHLTLTSRTDFSRNVAGAMWAFHGSS
jgi:hypothetical protein